MCAPRAGRDASPISVEEKLQYLIHRSTTLGSKAATPATWSVNVDDPKTESMTAHVVV